ncbi:class II aldolase/adducin family protein [Cypionkella sp.]|uniref:class II aldolase/adducin family protein n=1 Tax=Cypionkella sp. TaxID=2811411 RepID=UPI002630ECB8|nr:class II aldolase/adducin family protein [Cypionkella sp.]MDB5663879.1 fuculose phosphate aldolase [Cypionkella sp.]
MTEAESRAALVAASQRTVALRLNSGTAGNLSLRFGAGMLITPTGVPPDDMRTEQIVYMDMTGAWSGRWKPSSEWAIHLGLYKATEAQAVVHAHPDASVALSCLRAPIPAFHYMVAGFGGDEIPCTLYATFGSQALADTVVATMGTTYSGCLMANHGIVTHAADMATALLRAEKLDMLARQYLLALSAGTPVLLTCAELVAVHARYAVYGKQPKA